MAHTPVEPYNPALAARLRLYAAAPDLLEALERMTTLIDNGFLREPNWENMTLEAKQASKQQSLYNQARIAIAKATGGK